MRGGSSTVAVDVRHVHKASTNRSAVDEQVPRRGDRELSRCVQPRREEFRQQPKPPVKRCRQWRKPIAEESRRPQGRQEFELAPDC